MKKVRSFIPYVVIMALMLAVAACSSASAASTPATPSDSLPASNQDSVATTATDSLASASTESATNQELTSSAAVSEKLNLNIASASDFLTVPNVGDRMVREFQEYRPYTSILQFRREIGKYVSDDQVAEYEQYVYVPISVNDSDAATLLQIPSLDESSAEALIAGRPYASNQAFLDRLSEYVSASQLETAQSYLAQ